MSKIKIETNNVAWNNREIMFGDKKIKFDRVGKAEIEEKGSVEFLEVYKEFLFKEGELSSKDSEGSKVNNDPMYLELVEKFQKDLATANEKIKDRESKITQLGKDVNVWKAEYEKLAQQEGDNIGNLSEELKVAKIENEKLVLENTLLKSQKKDLIVLCEKHDLPKEQYEGKNARELVEILVNL